MKIGDDEIYTSLELDEHLARVKLAAIEAGMDPRVVSQTRVLRFECAEHGRSQLCAGYGNGVLVVACEACQRPIVSVAVAEGIDVRLMGEVPPEKMN